MVILSGKRYAGFALKAWIAHSAGVTGQEQTMREHTKLVLKGAIARCPEFLVPDVRWAALLHDFGKYSDLFRERLAGRESGLDHWAPGAHLLLRKNGTQPCYSQLAGMAVHGHHVGLGKWDQVSELKDTLVSIENRKLTVTKDSLADSMKALAADGLMSDKMSFGRLLKPTVASMLDARMVLSALVDADYTDTAHHMRGVEKPKPLDLKVELALEELANYVATCGKGANKKVKRVRAALRVAAMEAAVAERGIFTLEAPTGSGKTLAMLEFALRHMIAHPSLKRIVVALPFLSITDQTVDEYRKALNEQKNVLLEHHSLAEWRRPLDRKEDENGVGDEQKRREAQEAFSQDWSPPIIVTTTVQLLESLFTDHSGTSRKLCSLANTVIMIDEVQTIPSRLLLATARALSRLAHPEYGSSVVLSTATQPLLSHFETAVENDGTNAGWKPTTIISREAGLFEATRRYEVDWSRCKTPTTWEALANEIAGLDRVLCVVNTRKDARNLTRLVQRCKPKSPVFHLSTNMCAEHRRAVIRDPLIADRKRKAIVISTQCIEAGVDLDFPILYRALAPLDSIAQAAGRCNRAGVGTGEVRVFLVEGAQYPGETYKCNSLETMTLLDEMGDLDLQSPKVFDKYFERLYVSSNTPGTTKALEKAIEEKDFPTVAKIYRLIEHKDVIHVLVPYGEAPKVPKRLDGEFFRQAQPFTVDANRQDAQRSVWLGRPIAGTDDWYTLADELAYDSLFGLLLDLDLPIV